jgi:hypothetical protein
VGGQESHFVEKDWRSKSLINGMPILTIKKLFKTAKNTIHGEKIKVGIITEEYGDIWINSLMTRCDLKEGDVIEAEVTRNNFGLHFKLKKIIKDVPITHKKSNKSDNIKWLNAINCGYLLVAHGIIPLEEAESYIEHIYHLEPLHPERYNLLEHEESTEEINDETSLL